MPNEVFEQIAAHGVIPIIAIDSLDAALPLADALLEGGLPVVEITFRTAVAADVMQKLSEERPSLLVGAGTVLTPESVTNAVRCGAKFAVAPGLNPEIVDCAQEQGLAFAPGVATASDIECALSMGCITQKLFPAGPLGGTTMLKALAGPYAHTGVRFVPTGGVTIDNLPDYLAAPCVAAVGGTWLAKKDDIAAERWDVIRDRVKAAVEVVSRRAKPS